MSSDMFALESAELGKVFGDVLEECVLPCSLRVVMSTHLQRLCRINLSNNKLTSLSLASLTKLRRLFVAHNKLRTFAISPLHDLQVLDVADNELRHVPQATDGGRRLLRVRHRCVDVVTLIALASCDSSIWPEIASFTATSNSNTSVLLLVVDQLLTVLF